MKRIILVRGNRKVNGNRRNKMFIILQWRKSHCRAKTRFRHQNQIQKSKTVNMTGSRVGKSTTRVRPLPIKNYNRIHQAYQFHHTRLTSDSNGIRTHNYLDGERTLNHLAKVWPVWLNGRVFVYELSGCGFKSPYCHLNFRYRACFKRGVL